MIEAARTTAADIERNAEDSAAAHLQETREMATRVADAILALENELSALKGVVGQEHDALRAKVDRTRLRSSVTTAAHVPGTPLGLPEAGAPGQTEGRSLGRGSAVEESDTAEVAAPEAADPESAGPGPEPNRTDANVAELESEPETSAEPQTSTEPEASSDIEPEPVTSPVRGGSATASPSVPGKRSASLQELGRPPEVLSRAEPETLTQEAQSRVVGKTDLELAELHDMASDRAEKGPEGEKAYWSALVTATVTECGHAPRVRPGRSGRRSEGAPGQEAPGKHSQSIAVSEKSCAQVGRTDLTEVR